LWLASNYKREVELPQGVTDPTRAENQPNAHYYGVSAGAQYLKHATEERDMKRILLAAVVLSLNFAFARLPSNTTGSSL